MKMKNIIMEYREKKKRCKRRYGLTPKFGENPINYAHRVAVRKLTTGVDMVETEAEVMTFLGYRLETEDEQIERLVASEVRLAIRQKIHKSRYFGNVAQMVKDIRDAFLTMNNLDKPKWVKK